MSIAVALSGGIDSFWALHLLKEQGYTPVAVHALFLSPNQDSESLCQQLNSICQRLRVPFYVLDLHQQFQRLVVEPFIQSYVQGVTPNPCALCNERIKFGLVLNKVKDLGLNTLVTGHYAILKNDGFSEPELWRGRDPKKDQSYFLTLVASNSLRNAYFPLGKWYKQDVRKNMQTRFPYKAITGESQEICFIPGNDYRSFLKQQDIDLPSTGDIKDSRGKVLGQHYGLYRYTIGQRRGLGIPYREALYVLKKDLHENTLVVGTKEELKANLFQVSYLNYLVAWPRWPEQVWVQTNYRQRARPAEINCQENILTVQFKEDCKPVAPGQVAAFYTKEGRVLGGGIINA